MSDSGPLDSFHPLVREWFLARYGAPTPVQAAAWPRAAAGEHLLAIAPTGSGKTLAAFLEAISRLASGELPADVCSVLYVSPLKALGEDVRRNLEAPLSELAALFRERGVSCPSISVATRSGDTSQSDRRRMLSRPPSILVTTPESLAIMLDAASSRRMLSGVRLLVLDEVHAVAGNKRGSLLACSVGRLAMLAGEFQRLALSATVKSPAAIAAFVGGRALSRGRGGEIAYRPRRVSVVDPPADKRIELGVEWPERPPVPAPGRGGEAADSARYDAVVPALCARIDEARNILVFTDSRRRAERLAFLINEARGETAAWSHHGSLSKEVRRAVEARFKAGELACVVATASLELGIDVGSVREVELAGAPASVSSALQRIGRSGHGVGELSRGRLYPFHGLDLVLAAATARGVEERAVEEQRPVSCPLDVLAQVLLQLALESDLGETAPRSVDELYDIVLSFPPFEALARPLFDSVVEMLAGRYAGARLRELEPRISLDRASGLVKARDGVRALLNASGGAIPDRGLYSMRLAGPRSKIGELDEEFVWERKVGESFALGSQVWRIVEIGSESVDVVPASPDPDIVPFWKGEARFRSPEISRRALELLDALGDLDEEGGETLLRSSYRFDEGAARACSRFVAAQKSAGGGRPSLPGSRRLVLERADDPVRKGESARLVLHSLRGLAINEPLGMALSAAWEEELGLPVRFSADDDSILLVAPIAWAGGERLPDEERGGVEAAVARAFATVGRRGECERLVRSRLEGSGLFGAQFRENAGRCLLLPRGLPGRRVPLWVTRLRAKKLFDAVSGYEDFPAIVETWRSCLGDLLDLEGAASLAREVAAGRVELSSFAARMPSPLARESVWREIGENVYAGDELASRPSSSVSDRVISEALRSARSRPKLGRDLVLDYERRLKRLLPGWGPEDPAAFAEWIKERVLVPVSELPGILAASDPGLAAALDADPSCGGRVSRLLLPGAAEELFVHEERRRGLEDDPAGHVAEWLRREALVRLDRLTSVFGIRPAEAEALVDSLEEEGTLAAEILVEGEEGAFIADAENLEVLLRRTRRAARPSVEARPREDLFLLAAAMQGLSPHAARGGGPGAATAALSASDAAARRARALAALEGFPVPVAVLESEVLSARTGAAEAARAVDEALESGLWLWFGAGRETAALARIEDLELFTEAGAPVSRIVPESGAALDFWALRELSGLGAREAAMALWAEAWRGLVAADSYAPLREGLLNGFGKDLPEAPATEAAPRLEPPFGSRRRLPRAYRERWRAGSPVAGRWFRLDLEEGGERDALDEEDLDAARARILVARHGLVCRELLERELPALRWGGVFTALRRLELSGELLSGSFFSGIEGPQFMGAAAFETWKGLGAGLGPLWINAVDPAAAAIAEPVGEGVALPRPPRLATTRVCVSGGRAVAVSSRSFRDLALAPGPEDPLLPSILDFFRATRDSRPGAARRILLETVNGLPAARSPYAGALREAGFEADRGRMSLW